MWYNILKQTYLDLRSGANGLHNMGDRFIVDELLAEVGRAEEATGGK